MTRKEKRIEGGPTKLLLRWSGPFKVIKKGSNDNVWIMEQEGKEEAINAARLLAYEPFRKSSTPRMLLKLQRRSQEACAAAADEQKNCLVKDKHLAALKGEKVPDYDDDENMKNTYDNKKLLIELETKFISNDLKANLLQ